MRLLRVLAAVLGGGVLLLPGAAATAAPQPGYVGIVIGDRFSCVRWHAGITGDDVLNDVADVTYRSDGIVLTINGQPDPPHADDTHFWSYWHDTGGQWHYSDFGASAYQPAAGTVEGWSYDDGHAERPPPASNPAGLYPRICGSRDQPAPSRTPTRTHSSAHRHTHSHTQPPTAAASSPPRAPSSPASSRPASPPRSVAPARTPTASHRGHPSATRTTRHDASPASASPEPSGPRLQPAAQSLRPLPARATAKGGGGSPAPLIVGIGAAVVIGAGGAWTALRRRAG